MKPLLSLVGIFKNEASNIRKVLEAAKPFVDTWHVYDTGSQDGTQGIVKEVMDGVPGELHEGPFVDFATARNTVLDFAAKDVNHAEFQIMISGDEFLRNGEALRTYLESHRDPDIDCHLVRLFLDDSTFLAFYAQALHGDMKALSTNIPPTLIRLPRSLLFPMPTLTISYPIPRRGFRTSGRTISHY